MIYCEDCLETMKKRISENSVDMILTSPPYNINRHDFQYDKYKDKKDSEEYSNFILNVFHSFEKILKLNGVIIWNWSFGNSNISQFFILLSKIITETDFELKDRIIWKKNCAMPDNLTPNKLTRIVEDVFIFGRKGQTINTNKRQSSVRKSGQKMYKPIYNFIEAKNNDGLNNLNKAIFSTELVIKLLDIYGKKEMYLFDPFIGTGTTAVAFEAWGGVKLDRFRNI